LLTILSTNRLLNSFQSAYIKHHSTGTTLLRPFMNISSKLWVINIKVICITLLDLSATFNTIDIFFLNVFHPGMAFLLLLSLSWIKSYLLNCSFYVNSENSHASVFQLFYVVPPGYTLGPFLFILYTTSLSTLSTCLLLLNIAFTIYKYNLVQIQLGITIQALLNKL